MAGPLDQHHPFRQSIKHDASGMPTAVEPSGQNPAGGGGSGGGWVEDSAEHSMKMFKFRLRIAGCVAAVVLAFYLYINLWKFIHRKPSDDDGYYSSQASAPGQSGGPYDWSYEETRKVDKAWRSLGFFDRFFCSGGRRSAACD